MEAKREDGQVQDVVSNEPRPHSQLVHGGFRRDFLLNHLSGQLATVVHIYIVSGSLASCILRVTLPAFQHYFKKKITHVLSDTQPLLIFWQL